MDDKVAESLSRLKLATQGHHQIDTDEQDNFYPPPLFRLPAELRLMIYQHVFANETIQVQPKSIDPFGGSCLVRRHGLPKYQQTISLLMTCRQIRGEATPSFNGLVIFDLTLYYNCMAAAYELGPEMCHEIRAIKVESRLAKRHLLPSLQRVYMQQTSMFGLLMISPDMAVRGLRLYFGHSDLEVIFSRTM